MTRGARAHGRRERDGWVEGSSGVIDWHPEGDGYVSRDYSIHLLAPYRWEITFRDSPVAYSASRKIAVGEAEHHRLEAMRRADLWLWGVLLVAALAVMAVIGTAVRGTLGWFLTMVALLYVAVSAFVRFFAALTRNRADPYRHRLWWERRARWWDPIGLAANRWWHERMLPATFDDEPPAVRPLPPGA